MAFPILEPFSSQIRGFGFRLAARILNPSCLHQYVPINRLFHIHVIMVYHDTIRTDLHHIKICLALIRLCLHCIRFHHLGPSLLLADPLGKSVV